MPSGEVLKKKKKKVEIRVIFRVDRRFRFKPTAKYQLGQSQRRKNRKKKKKTTDNATAAAANTHKKNITFSTD